MKNGSKCSTGDLKDLRPFAIPGKQGLFFLYERHLYEIEGAVGYSGTGERFVRGVRVENTLSPQHQRISPVDLCALMGLHTKEALLFRGRKPERLADDLGRCSNKNCKHAVVAYSPSDVNDRIAHLEELEETDT